MMGLSKFKKKLKSLYLIFIKDLQNLKLIQQISSNGSASLKQIRGFELGFKSILCHLLESFEIVHVLTEAFWGYPYRCPDSPISTIYYTEFHHAPCPLQVSCTSPFSSLLSACRIQLHIASNRQFQNISVGLGH